MKKTRDEPFNEKQIKAYRSQMIDILDRQGHAPPESFTCDDCDDVDLCVLAFDPYNTNGDCLASK